MAYEMSPNAKLVVSLVVLVAIIIPILLAYVLIFPLGLSPTRSVAAPSSSSSSSTSAITTSAGSSSAGVTASGTMVQVILPAGVGTNTQLNFQPSSLTVAPGTTIVFVQQDTATHNVHFTSVPSGATNPANPSPDTTKWSNNQFSVTLTTPGTYTYICDYHFWMKGTITVT